MIRGASLIVALAVGACAGDLADPERFADCPPGTPGIGVRIEDDVQVTADGHRNLTRRLASDPSDVAALVRG